jgi:hypothetical protein
MPLESMGSPHDDTGAVVRPVNHAVNWKRLTKERMSGVRDGSRQR